MHTILPGRPLPLGATRCPGGVNFAFFSRHGQRAAVLLFPPDHEPVEISLDPRANRTGDIWHVFVAGLAPGVEYALRVAGAWDPTGAGHRFDGRRLLLDPYARHLTGGERWGRPGAGHGFARRCRLVENRYDWEGDRPLGRPLAESVIYELHVRAFTVHSSSGVAHPGTYEGLVEKIPYLQKLGVTAVELMPVFEFNENEIVRRDPISGERLRNLWGYSPIGFFAPKASYAADAADPVTAFRNMVKALHRAGIEVILDVVFNHTAEGGEDGPVLSFKGLDNTIYYLLDPATKAYRNFSGCGNTLNCNHPLVRQLIIDCLRYWVVEMHVDGFRFDLASILGRDQEGRVLDNPPVVEQIAEDPVLRHTKIIAEAWDAAGLYQVGSFSRSRRWAEWNGRFRDDVRAFMAGRPGTVGRLATRIAGSEDLYAGRGPTASINYVTCHDGFTLADLVSYEHKHNKANGEDNRDGVDDNISWNGGVEGPTSNARILRLRRRRMRTFAVLLLLSQGVPMLLAGDEFGRSQRGNNNAYCQDNPIGWVDWSLAEKNADLLRFFRKLVALRRAHPVFRRTSFFPAPAAAGGACGISWSSAEGKEDWSEECRTLVFVLDGRYAPQPDDDFCVCVNGDQRPRAFLVPPAPNGHPWRLLVDTAAQPPADIVAAHAAPPLGSDRLTVGGFAAVVLSAPRSA